MIIEKFMNNNCVQASVNGQEVIISGPGVGYNKNMVCRSLSILQTGFFMSEMSKKINSTN
ncbi:antiterminator [Escherichia coli]|nr:antiterminator [Escherichia coli]HCO8566156.1 RNA-binding protein [Escherichia coli]